MYTDGPYNPGIALGVVTIVKSHNRYEYGCTLMVCVSLCVQYRYLIHEDVGVEIPYWVKMVSRNAWYGCYHSDGGILARAVFLWLKALV